MAGLGVLRTIVPMETVMLLVLLIVHLADPVSAGYMPAITEYGEVHPTRIPFSPKNVRHDELVFAYLGIPYAEPPLGERRFYPPEPVQPWEDVLNATTNPPSCPQVTQRVLETSEDCLYLNVYVPETVTPNASVMVYIHGGGFTAGSGSGYPVNPVPLAALGGVIVVTFNYRLNIFGFFTTGEGPEEIPPNLGLLDQRLALRWVYENIAAFGGDPESITVFGQSAGAASVGWHLLLEDSRRYFKRVILQSGVPLNLWTQLFSPEEVREVAARAGDLGECGLGNSVGQCLRSKSEEELLQIFEKMEETNPGFSFLPAFDGDFFPSDVPSLIRNGSYRDIDVLLGTVENEGGLISLQATGSPIERPFVTADAFTLLLRGIIPENPLLDGLVAAVYSEDIDDTDNYEKVVSAVSSDTAFTCGVSEFARQIADAGSEVYMYRITQVPTTSIWNRDWLGAVHGDDLQYVFALPLLEDEPLSESRYRDAKLAFYMIRMWSNFAKSGNPNTPRALPRGISEWPRFLSDTELYKELDIATGLPNRVRLRQHYCTFWDDLVPQIFQLAGAAQMGEP